jgi:hypothetical protein
MNILPLKMMKIFLTGLVIFFGSKSFAFAEGAETDYGPMFGYKKYFQIQMTDCEKNWQIENRYLAICKVKALGAERSFIVSIANVLRSWRYSSGKMWRLTVQVYKLADGYKIQMTGEGDVPADRFQFRVAKKYILSALKNEKVDGATLIGEGEDLTNKKIEVLVVQPKSSTADGGTLLGPVNLSRRSIAFKSPAFLKHCISKLAKISSTKRSCVIHFATYREGEVVLSNTYEKSEVQSANGKQTLKLVLTTSPGWMALGPASLVYARVDFSGPYDVNAFNELYTAAAKKIAKSTFQFDFHKIGNTLKKSKLFTETIKGPIRLLGRDINFDFESCGKNWVYVENKNGTCQIQKKWRGYRMSESLFIMQKSVKLSDNTIYLALSLQSQSYNLMAYGSSRLIKSFSTVEPFMRQAIELEPGGRLYDYALLLPK